METDALSQQAGDNDLMPAWSFELIGAAVLVSLRAGILRDIHSRRENQTLKALFYMHSADGQSTAT